MARFTPAAFFFFLATLISQAFAHPLLRRDISQLENGIQLAIGDVTSLSQTIVQISWAHSLSEQGDKFFAAFSTTTDDIQQCITEANSLEGSVDEADGAILLKLAQDFADTVTEMLGNLRAKYSDFKQMNLVSYILSEVNTLNNGVSGMTGKLESVLPSQSQGEASSIQQQMGPEFEQTITLYSS